jgi:hypothetical protein
MLHPKIFKTKNVGARYVGSNCHFARDVIVTNLGTKKMTPQVERWTPYIESLVGYMGL